MTDLTRRTAAVQRTLLKFEGRPLEWGRFDCAKLAVDVARNLGHKVKLSAFGTYRSPEGARAALARKGFTDLPQLVDWLGFERLPPARALPGDLIGFLPQPDPNAPLPGDDFTSLTIWVGNGRVLGFHAGTGACRVVQPDWAAAEQPPIAWRL